ncbi:MAG: hypothetical protein IT279_09680 [Ignavibacteriaceae bacterium]|nr:hypothetical protein [Ignavibacteriaceae bacterium]
MNRSGALVLLSAMFLLVGCSNRGSEKTFNGVQLYYTSDVTEAQADALGDYLIKSEFANGEPKTVQLAKQGNTYEFRMVVKKGIENDAEYAEIFKIFAKDISDNVFNGSQVDLHACDDNLETLRVFPMAME